MWIRDRLTRMLGVPDSALTGYAKTSFTDMSGYGWANSYIGFCEAKGIINGYGDGTFGPGRTCLLYTSYPDGSSNTYTLYEGDAGIELNMLNRLMFSIRERTMKLLVSTNINSDSRIVIKRNIKDRRCV